MSTQIQQLLAVALLVGGFALAGPPVAKPPEVLPAALQVGQDALPTSAPRPRPDEPAKAPPALPAAEQQGSKSPPVAKTPVKKVKPAAKDRTAVPKTYTNLGQKPKQRETYCDRLRRRLAATPNRVFSCAEMKAARACERPGDRGKATPAQIAKGWECWSSGQL